MISVHKMERLWYGIEYQWVIEIPPAGTHFPNYRYKAQTLLNNTAGKFCLCCLKRQTKKNYAD